MKLHLVSGFLGSGKTTAIAAAVQLLGSAGMKCAAIMNDQGRDLVDSGHLRALGVPTGEVAGGCFCCSYADFASEIERLRREIGPDVLFAEAVGSCTDLVATVARPLDRGYLTQAGLGSYSVFVDIRLMGMYLSGMGLPFSSDVSYIFERQVAEADLVVINKSDLMNAASAGAILEKAMAALPRKSVMTMCALDPGQVRAWVEKLSAPGTPRLPDIDVDYARYGAGEARLAWYDSTVHVSGARPSLGAAASAFMRALRDRLQEAGIPIGHAKVLVQGPGGIRKVSLTHDSDGPDASMLELTGSDGKMLVNVRAQGPALQLKEVVRGCLEGLLHSGRVESAEVRDERAFHPGFPNPTYRLP